MQFRIQAGNRVLTNISTIERMPWLPRLLAAFEIGGVLHIALWLVATYGSCTGSGVGAYACDGTLSLDSRWAVLLIAYIVTPVVITMILRRWRFQHAFAVALLSYLIGVLGAYWMFGSKLAAATPSQWLLWEVVTVGLLVPLIATGVQAITQKNR